MDQEFPTELIHYILSFLDLQDVDNFSQTCKSFKRQIFGDYIFWKRYLKIYYPEHYNDKPEITDPSYWRGEVKKRRNLDELQGWLKFKIYSHKELESLKTLNLEDNQLTSIPESIGGLTSLRRLSLGDNQLSSLPESIGGLGSLQALNLGWNKLNSLPESIGRLTSLQTLAFRYSHYSKPFPRFSLSDINQKGLED